MIFARSLVLAVAQNAEVADDPSTLIGRSVETAATVLPENKEFNWRMQAHGPKHHRQESTGADT